MFDYICNVCGHPFFLEEGYRSDLDAIACPLCGVVKKEDDDTFIKKLGGEDHA